jgi:hypothetical protein
VNGLEIDWIVNSSRVSPISYMYPSTVVRQMPKLSGSTFAIAGMVL